MANEDHPDLQFIEQHVAQIMERFENVQIFASRYSGDESDPDSGTVSAQTGAGNWHARRGQVTEWLLKDDERIKCSVRREEKDE